MLRAIAVSLALISQFHGIPWKEDSPFQLRRGKGWMYLPPDLDPTDIGTKAGPWRKYHGFGSNRPEDG